MTAALPWIAGALAVAFVLYLLFRKTEVVERDRPTRGYGVALSNAMAEFETVLSPAAEHRIEEERHQEIMRDVIGSSTIGDGEEE